MNEISIVSDIVISDPDRSLEYHLLRCKEVIDFCNFFSICFTRIGIHGSVPYVGMANAEGKICTIHCFKGYSGIATRKFLFNFDPEILAIEDLKADKYNPNEGWIISI